MRITPFLIISLVLALPAAVYYWRLEALLWYGWHTYTAEAPADALQLQHYQVVIEGARIEGLADDVSGLTHNRHTDTLFTVLNREPVVAELSLDGKVLRKMLVHGVKDMEGITHVSANLYVLGDENGQRLFEVEIDQDTREIDVSAGREISLDFEKRSVNKGLEGVSWDDAGQRLLVVKERDPLRLLSVEGLLERAHVMRIKNLQAPVDALIGLRDLSSVTADDNGHFVLLSDESKLAVEFDTAMQPVSMLALWAGFHGLHRNVPQAEGITIGTDRSVYIVSEPNLFYVFKPPAGSQQE
ncbi:hypothetical protein ED236_04970 [Pseudomethylobacillus aquaticus]|uniref:Uncharacterized protein n=1 Tax=Pseudomethylobacillus aquaticus TaxID=2676064 RepID=A0A3N0V2U2_9PROT|nr:SdiA-regulated domain-containing protein [Pseudomethylobacillus aquaticus]ROH87043.1 hypothetical protein ED236_04970 [Pseudomethylobacillus aquaticus]